MHQANSPDKRPKAAPSDISPDAEPEQASEPTGPQKRALARRQRLSAALRANLRRRKEPADLSD